MAIMTYAKFDFNQFMLTLIFGIRASDSPPPPPPGNGKRLKRLGLIGLMEICLLPSVSSRYLCIFLFEVPIQVIPGNLQKYVSTNRSIFQCKTLPAHFSNNMMVYCLLNVI